MLRDVRTPPYCIPCLLRQGLDVAHAVTADVQVHEEVRREMTSFLAALDLTQQPSRQTQLVHRRLREFLGVEDPYRLEKRRFNRLALSILPSLAEEVRRAQEPILLAMKLSIAANTIDLGIHSALTDANVMDALQDAMCKPIYGDWRQLRDAAARAGDILFLADNAGEIVFDRLLIEELGPSRVTLVTRGGPVLNDATLDDARDAGLHELVEIMDNGSDAPGTILSDCSASFRERFRRASLVIAKGQGNLKTLIGEEADIFFLFKVKCPLVVEELGLPIGTHAIHHRQRMVDGHTPWMPVS